MFSKFAKHGLKQKDIEAIAAISSEHTRAADAYDAIIEWLFVNHPSLSPTGSFLHELVGRGTKSLPNERLDAFRVSLHARTVAAFSHPQVPESFMQKIGQAGLDMYQSAMALAKTEIEQQTTLIEDRATRAVAEAQGKRQEAESEAEEAKIARNAAEQRAVAEQDLRERTQNDLSAERSRAQSLENQLATTADNLRLANEQAERSQREFTATLNAERTSRAREQEIQRDQLQFANQQIDAARQQTKAIEASLKASETLRESIRESFATTQAELRSSKAVVNALTEENNALKQAAAQNEEQIQTLSRRLDQAQAGELAAKSEAATTAAAAASLREELQATNKRLDAALSLQRQAGDRLSGSDLAKMAYAAFNQRPLPIPDDEWQENDKIVKKWNAVGAAILSAINPE